MRGVYGNIAHAKLEKEMIRTVNPILDKESAIEAVLRLWEPLPTDLCQLVREQATVSTYHKNDLIYQEKEDAHQLFILVSGKVKLIKKGVGGHIQIIQLIKPIEMFGYRAYFACECHRTSAIAWESSVVVSVDTSIVALLMKSVPHLSHLLLKTISTQLGQSRDRILSLTQKHVRGRMAEALLLLKDTYHVESDGVTLDIHLSRNDLAHLSNMTTNNAIRTLSAFAKDGLVAISGKKIKILQEEELRRISCMG